MILFADLLAVANHWKRGPRHVTPHQKVTENIMITNTPHSPQSPPCYRPSCCSGRDAECRQCRAGLSLTFCGSSTSCRGSRSISLNAVSHHRKPATKGQFPSLCPFFPVCRRVWNPTGSTPSANQESPSPRARRRNSLFAALSLTGPQVVG